MIITHMNPDMDAIAGVWLLKRFGGLENEPVEFVNTGNPDVEKLKKAVAVVDTGRKLDSVNLRFDHHHLPGQDANDTCAAMQVYQWLKNFADIAHLEPLVNLIFAGDTGRSAANASRELGLHAIYSGWRAWWQEQNPGEVLPDQVALAYGFGLLHVLEFRLRKQAEARAELAEKTVYKSDDGLIRAIKHGSQGSTFAAYEEAARIIVFEGEPIETAIGLTYPVGIIRTGEWQEPHVGELVEKARELADWDIATGGQPGDYSTEYAIKEEIDRWFKHPAGFFAGRGTPKAPVFEPVEIDISVLAAYIDDAWTGRGAV